MIEGLEPLVRRVLGELGVEGVSVAALLFAASLALYAHKAASVGGTVATAGATAASTTKAVALVLVLLLVLGVISADVGRAHELVQMAWAQATAGGGLPW